MTNSSRNNKESVIFLHIPKAAGSTLHWIIEQQYEPTTIFTINEERTINDFTNLSEAERAEIRVLKGHMYFGLHKSLPQPSTYITILRDPIERVISHYYYVLREPRNELHERVTSQNMSLKDFVGSGIYLHLDNGQTRLISTTGADFAYGQCSEEMLRSAKENIKEHFIVVGLAERFDESLILLKRSLKWTRMPFYTKQNVTKNRPLKQDVSKDTLNLLEKYNELDIELYKHAQGLFEEIINQQVEFELELKNLKIINQVYYSANSSSLPTDLPELIAIPGINDVREINFKTASKNSQSGFFDEINGSSATTIEVTNATTITANGWAILADEGRIADMVIITYGDNNSLIAVAPVNWKRPDVVDFLKNPAYSNCGWMTTFNSSTLPASKVVLLAWAYNSVRKEAIQLNSTHEVVVLD